MSVRDGMADGQDMGVSDLRWDDVREWFDPEENGVLPDVTVPGTDVGDWQAVLDLVRSKGWAYEYSEDGRVGRVPTAEVMIGRLADASVVFKVWPVAGVQVNFFPLSADEVLLDVDLRELQGQARLDALCAMLRAIGRRLAKPVQLSPEGDARPVLGYQPASDRVVLLRSWPRG